LIRRADQLSTHDVRAKAEKIWRASLRLDELTETILSYKPGDRRWNRTQPKRVQPR
jgi:hypothetical protein